MLILFLNFHFKSWCFRHKDTTYELKCKLFVKV